MTLDQIEQELERLRELDAQIGEALRGVFAELERIRILSAEFAMRNDRVALAIQIAKRGIAS